MNVIGVIGGGTMGAGIAQVALAAGETVHLLEANRSLAERAAAGINAQIDRLADKGRVTAAQAAADKKRLAVADGPQDLRGCHVIIEAVVEDLAAKATVLREVLACCRPDAILASNTSSLSISALGRAAGAPARVCGMHFFNPAPLMPLVEVVAGRETAAAAVDRIFDLATRWGKTAVRAADTPGFIVNRVARPFYLESLRIVEERQASCEQVDTLMKSAGGFRMGPFELMDLIGIDINYAVTCSVHEQSGRPARFRPSPIQAELVARGQLGRKTGEGIYRYGGDSVEPALRVELQPAAPPPHVAAAWKALAMHAGLKLKLELDQGVLFGRVVCALMNEAALAAEEGVATDADIDLAMQKGTNYPRGLLAWAAEWGHQRVGAFLRALNEAAGDGRFAPAARFCNQGAS